MKKRNTPHKYLRCLTFMFATFFTACGMQFPIEKNDAGNGEKDVPPASEKTETGTETEKPVDPESKEDPPPTDPKPEVKMRTPCTTSWVQPLADLKMSDIVALINTLPKPVTLPCVLDVLPRPFAVHATNSDLSVQPADGVGNPRIFVSIDFLLLSFTLAPDEPSSLEFSQLLNDDESVKGEISFPVSATLLPDAPITQVLRQGQAGTRCAACHFGERQASAAFPTGAFVSRALRPFDRQTVSFEILKEMAANCATMTTPRCELLNALFRGSMPTPYVFPAAMPTLF